MKMEAIIGIALILARKGVEGDRAAAGDREQ